MSTVSRTFSVTPPPQLVVDYLADFGNAVEWDPGTVSCTRVDGGPVRVGSSWHNVSKIAGISTDLTYTLEELEANKIVLIGRNDTATSVETITVEPDGTGSTITYRNDLEMHGVAKLATPVMKLIFEKLGNDTEKQVTDAVNKLS